MKPLEEIVEPRFPAQFHVRIFTDGTETLAAIDLG